MGLLLITNIPFWNNKSNSRNCGLLNFQDDISCELINTQDDKIFCVDLLSRIFLYHVSGVTEAPERVKENSARFRSSTAGPCQWQWREWGGNCMLEVSTLRRIDLEFLWKTWAFPYLHRNSMEFYGNSKKFYGITKSYKGTPSPCAIL